MRSFAKTLLRLLAVVCISPLLVTHGVFSRLSSADGSLETHSQLLSLFPGRLGSYLRVAFYRYTLDHCDLTATISFGVLFSKTSARIGDYAYIGPRCMLGCVTVEADVLLAPAVQIPSGPHIHGTERLDQPIRMQPGAPCRVTIGRDSWIGAGAIVLADVGEQSIVGAGSVVTRAIPSLSIAGGVPADVLRRRDAAKDRRSEAAETAISGVAKEAPK